MTTPPQSTDHSADHSEPNGPRRGHPRLRHFAAKLGLITLFVFIATICVYGIDILLLVFAGILFAVFLRAPARWLCRKTSLSTSAAVILVASLMVLIIGLAAWAAAPKLAQQADELMVSLPKSMAQMNEQLSRYEWTKYVMARVPDPEQIVKENDGQIAQKVANYFKTTLTVIAGAFSIFFLGVFFAVSPKLYIDGVVALAPRHREQRTRDLMYEMGEVLEQWLLGRFYAMAIVFALTTCGLWLLKVEFALSLGLIAGVLDFVPNIGPIVAAIPAVLIASLQDPTLALWVAALYIIVQGIEGYIVTPLIQEKMVSLPPALVLSVQFLMGATLGVMGLALATPLAAAALVLTRRLYVEEFLGKETGDNGNETDTNQS